VREHVLHALVPMRFGVSATVGWSFGEPQATRRYLDMNRLAEASEAA